MIDQSIESFDRWYPPAEDTEGAEDVEDLEDIQNTPVPNTTTQKEVTDLQATLPEKIIARSENWYSSHSHIWSQKQLIADYANQFASAMRQEIDQWGNEELKEKILNPALMKLEEKVCEELTALQHNATNLPEEINARFSGQLKLIISGIDDVSGTGGLWGGGAAGIALAAGLYVFTWIAIVPIIIAAVAAALVSSFGLKLLDVDGIHDKIKIEVIRKGFEKFNESLESVDERLGEVISSAFKSRLEVADEAIRQIIGCYENALQVNQQNCRISPDQLQANRLWLAQKQQELRRIQQEAEILVKQLDD